MLSQQLCNLRSDDTAFAKDNGRFRQIQKFDEGPDFSGPSGIWRDFSVHAVIRAVEPRYVEPPEPYRERA